MRYLQVICEGMAVSNVHCGVQASEPDRAAFECSDPQLNELYRAGIETFGRTPGHLHGLSVAGACWLAV